MQTSNRMCNSEEYVLYIGDLPPELGKYGMTRIFSQFGAVKSIMAPEGVNYAFVVYSTYAEAEAAINALDNKPPLYLKVCFRKQKVSDIPKNCSGTNGQQSPVGGVETQQDFRYANSMMPTKSPMQYKDLGQMKPPTCSLSPHHYHMDPNGYVPNPNYTAYNPYDDLDYAQTSAMWSRGCLSVDAAGRRHIAMGRGHTLYHVPNAYPNIRDQIGNVIEIRNPGYYRFGIDESQQPVGKCMLCSRDAILLCSMCDGYYCSRDCQAKDWSKHEHECKKLPPLTYAANVGAPVSLPIHEMKPNLSEQSSDNNQRSIHEVSPKPIIRSESVRVENNNSAPVIQRSMSDDCNNRKIVETNRIHIDVPVKIRAPSQETLEKSTSNIANRLQKARATNMKTVDDNEFVFKRSTFLSTTNFTEVQIAVVLEPGLYYVQKKSDVGKLDELMKTLHNTVAQMPIVSKVIIGKIYGALYDGIWHRALVMSENPRTIDYIDYGTIEAVKDMEFRELGELAEIPRFSRIIKVSQSAKEKFKDLTVDCTVHVRMIDVNHDGAINVEIMDENTIASSDNCGLAQPVVNIDITPQSPKGSVVIGEPKRVTALVHRDSEEDLPSILDKMVAGITATAGIMDKIDDHTALAVLLFEDVQDDFVMLLEPLEQDCVAEAAKYKSFRPQLNELVCAKTTEGSWVRGRVTVISPTLQIASLDEGILREVDQILPMLPRYKQICTFGVTITTACKFPTKLLSEIGLRVTGREIINGETIVKGELTDEGFTGIQLDIKRWILPNESKVCEVRKPKLVGLELKNKSQVVVLSHRGPSIVFLRSLEEEDLERDCRLTQDVAKAAHEAPNLSSPPSLGDLVFAKYIDGNYYRAIVVAMDNDKIKIGYIDYGNNEVTELGKLKEMPQSLKERPRASARVMLKGIQNVPPTKEAIDYLGMLAANETPFICTFDGTIENGVTLTTAAGESVNDYVNDFLTPSYNKNDNKEDEDYLQLSDMDIGVLGNVGDTVNVYFLDTMAAGFKYVFAPSDSELISHISNVLPALLEEYCKTVKKYIPRANELCIARFEDGWYRGCCVKPSLTPTSAEIYFLDFGNVSEVNHDDIRIMKKDFLKPAPLGCICNVKGVVQESCEPSTELSARLEALLIPNEIYKIKILKYADLEWTIHLPEVRKTLMDEGLISM